MLIEVVEEARTGLFEVSKLTLMFVFFGTADIHLIAILWNAVPLRVDT